MGLPLLSTLARLVDPVAKAATSRGIDLTPGFNLPDVTTGTTINAPTYNPAAVDALRTPTTAPVDPNYSNYPQQTNGATTYTPNTTPPVDRNAGSYDNGGLGTNDQFNFYRGLGNTRLGQADTSYNNTLAGINQNYTTQANELNGARRGADTRYGETNTANQGQYQRNYDQIAQTGAQQQRGLLGYLASIGGSGGTNGQLVGQLVGQGVSRELAGANDNYSENARQNDTVYNNFINEETTNRKKLEDWKAAETGNATSQYNTTKQSLLDIIRSIDNRTGSAESLGSYINGVSVPNTTFQTNSYNGITPQYTAPALSTYAAKLPNQINLNAQAAQGGNPVSYLNELARQRKDNVIA